LSQFGVILALIFSLIIAIFAIANNQPIEVNYLYGKAEVSAIVVILGAAILGALVIFLLSMFRQIRISFQIRSLRNEVENYKSKNAEMEKERERLLAQVEQLSELSAGGQMAVTGEQVQEEEIPAQALQGSGESPGDHHAPQVDAAGEEEDEDRT